MHVQQKHFKKTLIVKVILPVHLFIHHVQ